jgi:hypothetical protein
VVLGQSVLVAFDVVEGLDDHLKELYVDLEGDGVDGWRFQGPNLASIRAVALKPKRTGTFKLVITATSMAGCSDRTGTPRLVIVKGS